MVSLKDRRDSGRYTPKATASPKELKANNIVIADEYDDWNDHRDGMRDWFRDGKMIKDISPKIKKWEPYVIKRIALNNKQKKLLRRRKARKSNHSK